MESTSTLELVFALVFAVVIVAFGLYGVIRGLQHSLNIIDTKQFQRPGGQLVTGPKAVWIGRIRSCAAWFALIMLGVIIYWLFVVYLFLGASR